MNINDIEFHDYFNIIKMCKMEEYDNLKRFILSNNINIDDIYFLRDICILNNLDLILYLKNTFNVNYIMENYEILKYLAFTGNVNALHCLLNMYNCYDDFMTNITYSALHNNNSTYNFLINVYPEKLLLYNSSHDD